MRKILFLSAIVCLLVACSTSNKVDLLVHNAHIYTVDSTFSTCEAMAIKDGKIVETGSSADLLKKYTATETVDAQGKFIYPGLLDAHAHFVGYAKSLNNADLRGTKSWDEVVARVIAFAKTTNNEWVTGRGWDQNDWPGKQFPTKEKLDSAFPDRPVYLGRIDGHAAIVNSKALQIAGIKAGDKLVGGDIVVNNNQLTGLLIDNATALVGDKIPEIDDAAFKKLMQQAEKNCFAVGLTGITDCGLPYTDVDLINKWQSANELQIRLNILLSDDKKNYDYLISKGAIKTDRLQVQGFKMYGDGALGSRGACLLHPYSDAPGHSGFLLSSYAHFDSVAALLFDKKFQLCTHAIGDSGNRTILNIYAKHLKNKNDLRWRIEHAQVVNENDFNFFGQYSIIPSVQPTHATSDMYWSEERLGKERIKQAYAYKQLLQQNGWLPLGTDFPVEDISPFKTFYAAVIRKDAAGWPANGFQTENALTREEALRGMTIWAARGAFEEKIKGSLEKGKFADFIILDSDLMTTDEKKLLSTIVLQTYIAGKPVFTK